MSDPKPVELDQMRKVLAEAIGVAEGGLGVERVVLLGDGPRAYVEIHLTDETVLRCDRFGDLMSPARLMALVTTTTGIKVVGIKPAQATQAVALMRRLAEVHQATREEDTARDYGRDFLHRAPTLDVDLDDQGERWRAFSRLEALDPLTLVHHAQAPNVAAASIVLVDATGLRYVHCGWFLQHVRRTWEPITPLDLALRMERVGWSRRGQRGRWKATAAGRSQVILLPLWQVPAGWEEGLWVAR